ncbi:hypothetical protein CTI12_AA598500 [Artemisia annua]|uniref:Uncharacterized protein n=1 Tax=Artemisia annua TaxID=35608 RepID=A0A2U1KIJ4_ARTAN|nr:hypothetical protein CTI12_AA598500 [Artemisia annua]
MASSMNINQSSINEPNIIELKEACGSANLATCFNKAEKLEATIRETRFRGPFNDKAVDALRCLEETHVRLLDRLQVLDALLGETRDGIIEKGGHVKLMEFDESLSDVE